MVVLIVFALLAGAGTAITPCVLPVLPALLSASAVGGRRRPVGIALGLMLTFTVTIAGLATVVDGVGVADGTVRTIAIAVLIGFGVMLLWPRLAQRVEAPLYRLARFGPRTRGDGFWSGIAVGGALGFLYAPCAGPILAAVVSVSATMGSSLEILAIALAYSAGSAAVLLALALGGRSTIDRIRSAGRGPGGATRPGRGDDRHRGRDGRRPRRALPDRARGPLPGLHRQPDGGDRGLRRGREPARGPARRPALPLAARRASQAGPKSTLPVLGKAPDFTDNQHWFNTDGRRLTMARPARPRRPDRLLDLHVHQLHPHAPVPARLGQALRAPRADHRRRAHARVRLREGRRQRRARDRPERSRATPSRRTTSSAPGRRGATSTGRPSTWSTRGAASATPTSAKASTPRPRRRSARCSPRRGRAGLERAHARAPRHLRRTSPPPRPTSGTSAPSASCPTA